MYEIDMVCHNPKMHSHKNRSNNIHARTKMYIVYKVPKNTYYIEYPIIIEDIARILPATSTQ